MVKCVLILFKVIIVYIEMEIIMLINQKIIDPFYVILKNREMIVEMSTKEIRDKYKGQPLGLFWALFHPLVLIGVYIFLYGVVFQTRVEIAEQNTMTFTAYLLSGMIPWLCIQSALTGGSVSVLSNSAFIKQVVFPVEVFPIKAVGSALIIEFIYLIIDIVYCIVTSKSILWTYILLPYIIVVQVIFLIGVNYFISAITVYLRDLKDIVQVFCMVGVYIMPVIYLPAAVPEMFQVIMYINPLSHYIWIFQDVLFYGSIEHWYSWTICTAISLVVLYLGHYVYKKLKIGFGSAL